jgi:hypothetical protein
MDAEAKARWAKEVGRAYFYGNEDRKRQLCSSYEGTVDLTGKERKVEIKATPHPFVQAESVQLEVVKV